MPIWYLIKRDFVSKSAQQPSRNRTNQIIFGLLIFIFAIIVGFYAIGAPTVDRQLALWHLLPTPDRYTTLSFVSPSALPAAITGTEQSFTFVVGNYEGQSTMYPYRVLISTNAAAPRVLGSGVLTLSADETINHRVTFMLPAHTPRTQITVELPGQNEEIHFWMGASS